MTTNTHIQSKNPAVTALILAGGLGSRFEGKDKGLIEWQGKAFIQHLLDRLNPQVQQIIINCNRHVEQYQTLVDHCVADHQNYQDKGPLAGIAAAKDLITTPYVFVCPCDTPLIPTDIVEDLFHTLDNVLDADIAIAHDGQRAQNLCFLARTNALTDVTTALDNDIFAVKHWLERKQVIAVDFSHDPAAFSNINSQDEYDALLF